MGRRSSGKWRRSSHGDEGGHQTKSPTKTQPGSPATTSLATRLQAAWVDSSSREAPKIISVCFSGKSKISPGAGSYEDMIRAEWLETHLNKDAADTMSSTDAPVHATLAHVIDSVMDKEPVMRLTETPESKRRSLKVSHSEKVFAKKVMVTPEVHTEDQPEKFKAARDTTVLKRLRTDDRARYPEERVDGTTVKSSHHVGRIADKISLFESQAVSALKSGSTNLRHLDISPAQKVSSRLREITEPAGTWSNSAPPNQTVKERALNFNTGQRRHETFTLTSGRSGVSGQTLNGGHSKMTGQTSQHCENIGKSTAKTRTSWEKPEVKLKAPSNTDQTDSKSQNATFSERTTDSIIGNKVAGTTNCFLPTVSSPTDETPQLKSPSQTGLRSKQLRSKDGVQPLSPTIKNKEETVQVKQSVKDEKSTSEIRIDSKPLKDTKDAIKTIDKYLKSTSEKAATKNTEVILKKPKVPQKLVNALEIVQSTKKTQDTDSKRLKSPQMETKSLKETKTVTSASGTQLLFPSTSKKKNPQTVSRSIVKLIERAENNSETEQQNFSKKQPVPEHSERERGKEQKNRDTIVNKLFGELGKPEPAVTKEEKPLSPEDLKESTSKDLSEPVNSIPAASWKDAMQSRESKTDGKVLPEKDSVPQGKSTSENDSKSDEVPTPSKSDQKDCLTKITNKNKKNNNVTETTYKRLEIKTTVTPKHNKTTKQNIEEENPLLLITKTTEKDTSTELSNQATEKHVSTRALTTPNPELVKNLKNQMDSKTSPQIPPKEDEAHKRGGPPPLSQSESREEQKTQTAANERELKQEQEGIMASTGKEEGNTPETQSEMASRVNGKILSEGTDGHQSGEKIFCSSNEDTFPVVPSINENLIFNLANKTPTSFSSTTNETFTELLGQANEKAISKPASTDVTASSLPASVHKKTTPSPASFTVKTTPPPTSSDEKTIPSPSINNKNTTPPPASSDEKTTPSPTSSNEKTTPPPASFNEKTTPHPASFKDKTTPPAASTNQKTTPSPTSCNEKTTPPPASLNEKTMSPPTSSNEKTMHLPASFNVEATPPPASSKEKTRSPPASTNENTTPLPASPNEKAMPPPVSTNEKITSLALHPPASSNKKTMPPPASSNEKTMPPPASLNKQTTPPPALINKKAVPLQVSANEKVSHTLASGSEKSPPSPIKPQSTDPSTRKKELIRKPFFLPQIPSAPGRPSLNRDSPSSWLDIDHQQPIRKKQTISEPKPKLSSSVSETNLLDTSGEFDPDDFIANVKRLAMPFSLPQRKHNQLRLQAPPFAMPAIREDRCEKPFDLEEFQFGLRRRRIEFTLDMTPTSIAKSQNKEAKEEDNKPKRINPERKSILSRSILFQRAKKEPEEEEGEKKEGSEERKSEPLARTRLERSSILSSLCNPSRVTSESVSTPDLVDLNQTVKDNTAITEDLSILPTSQPSEAQTSQADIQREQPNIPAVRGFHRRPGKIVIFEHHQFSGQSFEFFRDVPDATHLQLSSVISVKVIRGCWILYEKPGFEGRCIALAEEAVTELPNEWAEEAGLTSTPMIIGSIRLSVRDYTPPRIELFTEPSGMGRNSQYLEDTDEVGSFGLPLNTSSIKVHSGLWMVYSDPGFQGLLAVLEVGEYPIPESWGFPSPTVGSLRALRMGYLKIENPNGVKAVLYEKAGLEGRCVEVQEDVLSFRRRETDSSDLDGHGLKCVESLKIIGGLWVAYEREGFEGQQFILEEGEYLDWRDWGGTGQKLLSLWPVLTDVSSPHMKMFNDLDFGERGGNIDLLKPLENTADTSYGPHTCSIDVLSGVWVAFEDPGFSGQLYVLEKGQYGSPEDWGASNSRISSVIPVTQENLGDSCHFKIQLFSEAELCGTSVLLDDSLRTMPDGFTVHSCKVLAGSWLAFGGECFSGPQCVLEEGVYPDVRSMGFTHHDTLVMSLHPTGYEFSLPSIVLFERSGLKGRRTLLKSSSVNLQFTDCTRVSSILVEGGMWVLYELNNFRGAQILLKPGVVPDWPKLSDWPRIGSLRPLIQKQVHFRLRNKEAGLLMSVTGSLGDIKLMRIQATEETGGMDQIWIYQDGHLQCKWLADCCVDVGSGVPMAGSRTVLSSEPSQSQQLWNITSDGLIRNNAAPNLVLEVKGGQQFDKWQIILNEFHPNKMNQRWSLEIL
ncbi:beta/gamma crystallin domain-containing protein 1-like [Myxocyprinus asiaticus]|uniref:beta/gamma crystallin domain-containing protein 1-like n=1 Tax=Myxocyprinus asiaticus TaxID=70543 RepID=UPI00222245F3|nr:beta/gamma crystallin domain-containing protein 1-like [Myxocyprinus asiaticus]